MSSKTNPIAMTWIPITIFQLVSFIIAIFGVFLMVTTIRHEAASTSFFTGLFLTLGGSCSGVLLTLYSLRHF